MGHFFSLKNSKFFSGLKKMPHSAVHYYWHIVIVRILLVLASALLHFSALSSEPVYGI